MSQRTFYEWVAEVDDADDLFHTDTYADAASIAAGKIAEGCLCDVALVRKVYEADTEDLIDTQWAFVYGGALEPKFDRGAKVPKRFIAEVQRAIG
jgi:hypothetical protein